MEHVIGFFGGDHQVGTTMIAWSFAERMAERGRRVLLVFGSGGNDQGLMPAGNGNSIDVLKAALRSGSVEREDLLQCLERKRNLWILPGVGNTMAADQFLENTFQVLLEGVTEDFDDVVIDGGSDVRLGLTVSALHVCTDRFFVLTQQAKSLHRFLWWRSQFLEPLRLEGKLILNRYKKDPALFLKKDIERLAEDTVSAVIPWVEEGWQAEMERKSLLNAPRFARAIDGLVGLFVQDEKKEGRWKKRFN